MKQGVQGVLLPLLLVFNEIKDDSDVFDMNLIGTYHQRLNRQKQIDTKYNKCRLCYDQDAHDPGNDYSASIQ